MTNYISAGSGDWDSAATWTAGSGFPGSTDTASILNTHVVSVKGTEYVSAFTVNSGGTLRFDGQSDTVNAVLNIGNTTNRNNGTIDQTGTGTKYARYTSPGSAYLVGNQPTLGDGYWSFGSNVHNSMLITTGGGGCKITNTLVVDELVLSSGDTAYYPTIYAWKDVTFESGSNLDGTISIFGIGDTTFSQNDVVDGGHIRLYSYGSGKLTLGTDARCVTVRVYDGCELDMGDNTLYIVDNSDWRDGSEIGINSGGVFTKGAGSIIFSTTSTILPDMNYIWDSNPTPNDLGALYNSTTTTLEFTENIRVTNLWLAESSTTSQDGNMYVGNNGWFAVDETASFDADNTHQIIFDGVTNFGDYGSNDIGKIEIDGSLILSTKMKCGDVTISSGQFDCGGFGTETDGNWTHNGGVYVRGTESVIFTGASKTITGMGATSKFNDVIIKTGASISTAQVTQIETSLSNSGTWNSSGIAYSAVFYDNLEIESGATYTDRYELRNTAFALLADDKEIVIMEDL